MAFALSPGREAHFEKLLREYPDRRAVAIPLMHLCQEQAGWLSPEAIDYVAERLTMPTATIQGIATFYTSLFTKPMAPNRVWVCRTLACELRGACEVQQHLRALWKCDAGGTSADGRFALMKAECLAGCGYGPVVQVNDRYIENFSLGELEQRIEEAVAEGPSPMPGLGAKPSEEGADV